MIMNKSHTLFNINIFPICFTMRVLNDSKDSFRQKNIKVESRFRQENLMLSSHEVKQVNIILLVVGSLIPKSCKLTIIFLKKEIKQFRFSPATHIYFDISQPVDGLFIFLMVSFDKKNTLILMQYHIFNFFLL